MTFRFIADHQGECPAAWACDALDVSESGCHAWIGRSPSQAELRRDQRVAAIERVHAEVKERYGSPRMTAELNARGCPCASKLYVLHVMRTYAAKAYVYSARMEL